MIVQSGKRLLRLVSDILDFSRIEAGKVELQEDAVSLRAVVQEAVEWCVPLAGQKGLAFTWSVDPELPENLSGDAMRISQVLTNLLENAVKFTETGEIVLAVEFAGVHPDHVDVRFAVKDSGVGIPDDQLDSAFRGLHPGRCLHDSNARWCRTRAGDLSRARHAHGWRVRRPEQLRCRQHVLLHLAAPDDAQQLRQALAARRLGCPSVW